jgi:hypothetical protein
MTDSICLMLLNGHFLYFCLHLRLLLCSFPYSAAALNSISASSSSSFFALQKGTRLEKNIPSYIGLRLNYVCESAARRYIIKKYKMRHFCVRAAPRKALSRINCGNDEIIIESNAYAENELFYGLSDYCSASISNNFLQHTIV